MVKQERISLQTTGRDFHELTQKIISLIAESNINKGLCHLFIPHTSAALVLCENYDAKVRQDLESFFSRMIPDGSKEYRHHAEGADDMPAHIRSILTHSDITLPIVEGELYLGKWQGIYLWEHRAHEHNRSIWVTMMGE